MQAILFDFDGTLVDSLPALRETYSRFLTSRGKCPTPAEFDQLNGPSLREIVSILATRHLIRDAEEQLYAEYIAILESTYLEAAQPFPNAERILEYCRHEVGLVCLVTSTSRALVERCLEKFGWHQHFDLIVCGDDVARSKPAPDIYLQALQKLNIEPSAALAIEDSPNGVRSAKLAALNVVAISCDSNYREMLLNAGAMGVLLDLGALPDEIARLNTVS